MGILQFIEYRETRLSIPARSCEIPVSHPISAMYLDGHHRPIPLRCLSLDPGPFPGISRVILLRQVRVQHFKECPPILNVGVFLRGISRVSRRKKPCLTSPTLFALTLPRSMTYIACLLLWKYEYVMNFK